LEKEINFTLKNITFIRKLITKNKNPNPSFDNYKTNIMKKVLIALDYDSNSNEIAKIGYQLAQKMGAQTILLHVLFDQTNFSSTQFDPMMGMGAYDYNVFAEVVDAESYTIAGIQYLEHIKKFLNDDSIQLLVKIGDASDEILATSISTQSDLIVMGTHSKKWLEKVLVGSVAASVLEQTEIPLLVIPTKKSSL
jgi:nucleotide-binding universal stress UspA family protein